MTVGTFLETATKKLRQAGMESARLDVLVLLEDALHKNKASILAHFDDKISKKTEVELNTKIAQRQIHTPLAYIRGHAEFYGRDFLVSPSVLVPRPETEAMIDLLKAQIPLTTSPLIIADIGTGSGCVGITAALELPTKHLDLYDIDRQALFVAAKNAERLGIPAPNIFQEDLLTQANNRRYDVMLANLPYVPTDMPLNKAARHEPALAIFAGEDGLDLYRRFWDQITLLRQQPACILTESLPSQHQNLARLAKIAGYTVQQTNDYVQGFTRTN